MNEPENTSPPNSKAVAITRGNDSDPPRIAAKGQGYVAEKILDIAFAEGVRVRQDKDLVELLDAFDVDCPVPFEALHAVSLILERVYAENRKLETTRAAPQADSITAPLAEPMTDTER